MKAPFNAFALLFVVFSMPLHATGNPLVAQTSNQSSQASRAKIDLNKADVKTLSNSIKGIGQKRAEAIVKYREAHGKFSSIEDLAKVRGIGQQFVKKHLSQMKEVFTLK